MKDLKGYGVVYTPELLSIFVAELILSLYVSNLNIGEENKKIIVTDPACGDGALLRSIYNAHKKMSQSSPMELIGVDIDKDAIEANKNTFSNSDYRFYNMNSLLPSENIDPAKYWCEKISKPDLIIANPPWSSEKIFDNSELVRAGYTFNVGQYDSYVLFVELALKIVKNNGYVALIIPDSIFSGENQGLRSYLLKETEIKVIARLGEKIFDGINRATSVLVLRKKLPMENTLTSCFRLNTEQRKKILSGQLDLISAYKTSFHMVKQSRFTQNKGFVFDVDCTELDEKLLGKLENNLIDWQKIFTFGRGVEIAKSGAITICPHCLHAQGFSKKQLEHGNKMCPKCSKKIEVVQENIKQIVQDNPQSGFEKMYVGENLHRYAVEGCRFVKLGVLGINYKNPALYAPPKILVRKTGLGINAWIDYDSTYINQTIYSCNFKHKANEVPLEYYLGVLNSRVIYYYYLKKYGENEWKSHPYFTKEILFSLPLRNVSEHNQDQCRTIANKVCKLQKKYSRKLDLEIEELVFKLYDLENSEIMAIKQTINELPDLGAINHMKFREME